MPTLIWKIWIPTTTFGMMEMDSEEIQMLHWPFHGMLSLMLELFLSLEELVLIHSNSQTSTQMFVHNKQERIAIKLQ